MPQSYCKIWIHAIWATKLRAELIDFSIEKKVYDFIYEELIDLGCPVRIINGMPDPCSRFVFIKSKQISCRCNEAGKREFFAFNKWT